MRMPRKKKKQARGATVIYDINSIPMGEKTIHRLVSVFRNSGILFYDGLKGDKPVIIGKQSRLKIKAV